MPQPARPSGTIQQWKSHSHRARRSTKTKASPRRAMFDGDKHTQYSCMIVPRPLRANYVRPWFLMAPALARLIEGYGWHGAQPARPRLIRPATCPHPRLAAARTGSDLNRWRFLQCAAAAALLRHALAPQTCTLARVLGRPHQTGCRLQNDLGLLPRPGRSAELS